MSSHTGLRCPEDNFGVREALMRYVIVLASAALVVYLIRLAWRALFG